MFLEPIHGVVVSSGYADYLDISLTQNRPQLNQCVVVTTPDDKESQRVAGKHGCLLIVTEDGSRYQGEQRELFGTQDLKRQFNKGAMIERGLQQLPANGWRLHFDADIVLPSSMRQRLKHALHDRQGLYGVDRMNVVGWDAWQKLVASGWPAKGFEHHHFLSYAVHGSDVGSRLVYGVDQGYIPIGYFQLWHHGVEYSDIYRTRPYSTTSSNAAHDDVQFALRFDRHHRHLIPEFIVAHLVTDDLKYGKNWGGRVSKRFGPGPRLAKNERAESGYCDK